jgi:hypothetical protein
MTNRPANFATPTLVLLAITVFSARAPADDATSTSHRALTVDASHSTGPLKMLLGVSGAPDWTFLTQAPEHGPTRPLDLTEAYRTASVNLCARMIPRAPRTWIAATVPCRP